MDFIVGKSCGNVQRMSAYSPGASLITSRTKKAYNVQNYVCTYVQFML